MSNSGDSDVEILSPGLKRQLPADPSPYFRKSYNDFRDSPSDVERADSVGQSSFAFFDGMHGLQNRADQPRRKVRKVEDLEEEKKPSRSTHIHGSTGIVGDHFKPDKETAKKAMIDSMVDLTNDDEDEVVFTGERPAPIEVVYGHIVVEVLAYKIPKPKGGGMNLHQEWPVMKCGVRRSTIEHEQKMIKILDAFGTEFGNIREDAATPLAALIDADIDIRLQLRLLNRQKKDGDWPGQPCSQPMKAKINIYGPKSRADYVGKILGQANMWLKSPFASDPKISYHNPHATKNIVKAPLREIRRQIHSEQRTNEESYDAVNKLFDHLASSEIKLDMTEPPAEITTEMLDHQKQALTFMLRQELPRYYGNNESDNTSLWRKRLGANGRPYYEEVVSGISVSDPPEEVLGGLLADVMGLGKTIEALALIVASKEEAKKYQSAKCLRPTEAEINLKIHAKTTLLIAPLSALKNWEDQISDHIKANTLKVYTYHGANREQNPFELAKYDVLLTTYGMVGAEYSKAVKNQETPLNQIKFFRVMLDEAHTIREQKAMQSHAAYALLADRRWCLTGTPIQNRIEDLGSLTRFLRMYPYDSAGRFNQYIKSPAMSGDVEFLKSLRIFVDSFTLRRTKDTVDLPDRQDIIEELEFSSDESKMYNVFRFRIGQAFQEIDNDSSGKKGITGNGKLHHRVLSAIMTLRLICDHGRDLLKDKDRADLKKALDNESKGKSEDDAIDLDEDGRFAPPLTEWKAYDHFGMLSDAGFDACRECGKGIIPDTPQADEEDASTIRGYMLPCYDLLCPDCFDDDCRRYFIPGNPTAGVNCPFCDAAIACAVVPLSIVGVENLEIPTETPPQAPATPQAEQEVIDDYSGPHTKTLALLRDIEAMHIDSVPLLNAGEPPLKCVVFSEFTSHLNLIERALRSANGGAGYTFVRIDGTMSLAKRRRVLDALATDDNVTILLASIKAAGQGLNLTAASRAFIMEPMWNPAAENQAVDRIYRLGQKRNVIIKRFRMKDSIEGAIAKIQQKKERLANVAMERNHKSLSQREVRRQHMEDLRALFK